LMVNFLICFNLTQLRTNCHCPVMLQTVTPSSTG
jgi:hypothetical protein